MNFSKEQIEKAKNCKTIEEFKVLAKNEGLNLTEEETKMYFNATHGGVLNDDDLDKVAGGKGGKWEPTWSRETNEKCPFCGMVHKIKAQRYELGDARRYEHNPNRCPCGAEIRYWDTTMNYDFVKNGEERNSIRLG